MKKTLRIMGSKKSGKTALIEALSHEFTGRGFRVAALKTTSHDHEFDIPETDTWRFRKAGCETAVIISPGEFVCHAGKLSGEKRKEIYDILYRGIDLLFVEGAGDLEAPFIECIGADGVSRFSGDSSLLAVVSDHAHIPGCRNFKSGDADKIADFIIEELEIKKAGSGPAY